MTTSADLLTGLPDRIAATERLIRPYVRETPVELSLALSESAGADVWLKLENVQHTGSFKVRGAFSKLLRLTEVERARGIVTASSGNHGAATAWASRALNVPALVFVPQQASSTKLQAIRRAGAEVELYGVDGVDTEIHARRVAEERGLPYVSPYNDADIVAGQGTLGLELRRQLPGLDVVFIAVGGGGLIGGAAAALKAERPEIRIVGCLPEHSPVMARSVAAGAIIEMESLPTLSDGTAGGIEPGAVTFALCRSLVDEWVLVTEAEIAAAMRHCLTAEHTLVEGAAGVAVAGFWRKERELPGARVAVVLCGANVSVEKLAGVLSAGHGSGVTGRGVD